MKEIDMIQKKRRGRPKSTVPASTPVERMRKARERRRLRNLEIYSDPTNLARFTVDEIVTALYDSVRSGESNLNFTNRLIVSELILRFSDSN